MKKLLFSTLAATLLLSPFKPTFSSAESDSDTITIEIKNTLKNQTSIQFRTKGAFSLNGTTTLPSDRLFLLKKNGAKIELHEEAEGYTFLLQNTYDMITLTPISTDSVSYITYNTKNYTGTTVFKSEGDFIRPYNTLLFEEYLKGVVPSEMPAFWGGNGGMEALKAQAVAARSFAKSKLAERKTGILTDTETDQVYNGLLLNDNQVYANFAVEETKGQYLTFNEQPIATYFYSSNGGFTESNQGAWAGAKPLPYLQAKEDLFDRSTHTSTFSHASLIANLQPKEHPAPYIIKEILSIERVGFTEGKRTKDILFTVKTEKNEIKTISMKATNFRTLMGTHALKSTFLEEPIKTDTDFIFVTKGFGHGVGMSQDGAYNRAKSGQLYTEILAFYYSGTTLIKPSLPAEKPITTSSLSIDRFQSIVSKDNVFSVAFDTNLGANIDVTLTDQAGKKYAVKPSSATRWEGAGSHVYTYDGKSLAGVFTYEVRIARSTSEIITKSGQVTFVKPPPAPISTLAVTDFNASISKSNLFSVSFNTNLGANIDVSLIDAKGKRYQVKPSSATRWEGTGKHSYTYNGSALNGVFAYEVRIARSLTDIVVKTGNVTFINQPSFTGTIKRVSSTSVDIAYQVTVPSDITVTIQTPNGQVVATPYTKKNNAAGSATFRYNNTHLYGSYVVILTAKSGTKTETLKTNVTLSLPIPTYSKQMQTLQTNKATNVYRDAALKTKIGTFAKGTAVQVLSKSGNTYKVNYHGSTGYISNTAFTRTKSKDIQVSLGGFAVSLTNKPYLANKLTYMPIQGMAEAFDFKVSAYNAKTKQITLTKGKTNILLTVGNNYATINGKRTALNGASVLKNGKVYIPVLSLSVIISKKFVYDTDLNVIWFEK